MKRSELKSKIEEIITELLNEDTIQYTNEKGEDTISVSGIIGANSPISPTGRSGRSASLCALKFETNAKTSLFSFDGIETTTSGKVTSASVSAGVGEGEENNTRKRSMSTFERTKEVIEEFVHRPVARFEWNKEHTKVFRNGGHLDENWLSEFLDLILVAAMIKLGDSLHYCGLNYQEIFSDEIENVQPGAAWA